MKTRHVLLLVGGFAMLLILSCISAVFWSAVWFSKNVEYTSYEEREEKTARAIKQALEKEGARIDHELEKKDHKINVAKERARTIAKACAAYAVNHNGKYPSNLEQLLKKDEFAAGPYLDNPDLLLDPWSQPYQYQYPGTRGGTRTRTPDVFTTDPESGKTIGNWQTSSE
jgi:hypothetical protein